MIEMTWVADALKIGNLLITLVYFGAAAWLIYVALRSAIPVWVKASCIGLVVAAFGYLPVSGYLEYREKRAYSKAAWERFNKYCAANSGEKIFKQVSGAKSILIMRPRTEDVIDHAADQNWRGDPYGAGFVNELEIRALLLHLKDASAPQDALRGFDSVETRIVASRAEQYVNHHLSNPSESESLIVEDPPATQRRSRYGFTWLDLSADEDRQYWIAVSLLRIIDLETGDVIAERRGYMIDPGFGSQRGGRRPWLSAISSSCPKLVRGQADFATRTFLLRVLKPTD